MRRRDFLFLSAAATAQQSLLIHVQVLFDQGAQAGRGLSEAQRAKFWRLQETARREYAVSGIRFDVQVTEGAYLRTQTYSQIPDQFLVPRRINLFVSDTLRYDADSQRTGGSSIGPQPGSRFYRTFLGLREAGEDTLLHEYAHHFTLDTRQSPSTKGNFWADLRNDYWLWRQRHGVAVAEFRACAGSDWVSQG
jgi:hypothetical protein